MDTFTGQLLTICRPHEILSQAIQKVEPLYKTFSERCVKTQASAKDKTQLDKKRDRLIMGLFNGIKSETYFPHTGEASEVCDQLSRLTKRYGSSIARLSQNEETAQIDNLLKELEKINLQALQGSGISRWIEPLKQTNETFKTASNEYVSDVAESQLTESASEFAPQLATALDALLAMFYAFVSMQPSEALTKSYTEALVLVNSYR